MFDLPKRFGREDTGETSIEYGLIAAGIAVGIQWLRSRLARSLKSTLANRHYRPREPALHWVVRPL